MQRKNYIHSINDIDSVRWVNANIEDPMLKHKFIAKFPIKSIRLPKIYPNRLDLEQVQRIVSNFYEDAWEAVTIDENNFLRDGQHRLEAASLLRLKYIDVIVMPWQPNEKVFVYRAGRAYIYDSKYYGKDTLLEELREAA